MKKETNYSLSGVVSIALPLSLTGVNAIWVIVNWQGGALIALTFYSGITLLCLKRQHLQAGVIAGILGIGIHLYELFVLGPSELTGIDQVFFTRI